MNARAPARRYDSVQQDWRAILPEAKSSFFADHIHQLEDGYMIFSVALDEAISLHHSGDSRRANLEIGVVGEFCARLALRINAVLHAMRQYARHFGVVPNLSLLEAANFKGYRGQRAARHSNLVSQVLLSERSQFLNKLNTLEVLVDDLSNEFIEVVAQLVSGIAKIPSRLWESLETSHFDLNTCLRETDVLLKSFLVVLPEEQLAGFDFTICGLARARHPKAVAVHNLIRARRMATVAGE